MNAVNTTILSKIVKMLNNKNNDKCNILYACYAVERGKSNVTSWVPQFKSIQLAFSQNIKTYRLNTAFQKWMFVHSN